MVTQQPTAAPSDEDDLPEQMRVRRDKRQRLLDAGEAAYPLEVARTHTLAETRTSDGGQALAPGTNAGEAGPVIA